MGFCPGGRGCDRICFAQEFHHESTKGESTKKGSPFFFRAFVMGFLYAKSRRWPNHGQK
jgi:hypothetical protein